MNSAPPLPKKGACARCHHAKVKCAYNKSSTKCDRCIRMNCSECLPHVSKQGMRTDIMANAPSKPKKTPKSGKRKNLPKATSVQSPAEFSSFDPIGHIEISDGIVERTGGDVFLGPLGCNSEPLASKSGHTGCYSNDEKPAASTNSKETEALPENTLSFQAGDINEQLECFLDSFDENKTQSKSLHESSGVKGVVDTYAQLRGEINVNDKSWGFNNQLQSSFKMETQPIFSQNRADDNIHRQGEGKINDGVVSSKHMLHKSSKNEPELNILSLACFKTMSPLTPPTQDEATLAVSGVESSTLEQGLFTSLVTISLDEWITGALESKHVDGISSLPYLMAVLTIASLLTEKTLACIGQVDSLLDGTDWSDRIRIGLKPICDTDHSLHSLNYLQIHSAEILNYKRAHANTTLDPSRAQLNEGRAIYFLGLTCYKLFAGGENPSKIYALSSSEQAFVSLSKLSLVKQSDNDHSTQSESKHHEKPLSLCHISCQYLAIRGVPSPLCSLILNMIECVYGDLKGNDCYSKLNDISSDLNLLMTKPSIYLRCLETDELFSNDLKSNNSALSRDNEFSAVKSSYNRRVRGSHELAIIKGESGCGKSWLAHRIGMSIIEEGGIMLVGKFDQSQTIKPFSALASAFDMYCDIVINQKGSDWATAVVNNLQSVLNGEAFRLEMMIPKLSQILDIEKGDMVEVNDQNCQNVTEMNCYLLSQFIEVITAFSKSVTLCLDDVQWADEASVAVLNRLLRHNHKKFFFVGCCRGDEMSDDHHFWRVIKDVSSVGVCVTTVELSCIEENDLNEVISEAFCLLPRLVKPLSAIIYQKTQGNPLFFTQLLLSLYNDGLIQFDLRLKRYVWDTDKIAENKLPDNVAMCFTARMRKLPFQVKYALNTLALFGSSIREEIIIILEASLNVELTQHMEHAKAKGFISFTDGSYNFGHDRIQEVSFYLLPDQIRTVMQLNYGRCLIKHYEINGDNNVLFFAMGQINAVDASSFSDINECVAFASYNLTAGKNAMSLAEYSYAYLLFHHGIGFLRCIGNYWADHYKMTLEMFELAAKCTLVTKDQLSLQTLSDEILRCSKNIRDTLNVRITILSSLACSSKLEEALQLGLAMLVELGEGIDLTEEQLVSHTAETTNLFTRTDLRSHTVMEDTTKLLVMKVLVRINIPAFFVNSRMHSLVGIKMAKMSMQYGLSPMSPVGFVCFGSFLSRKGNLQIGKEIIKFALSLLDKLDGTNEFAGETYFLAASVNCFHQPLLATNELRVKGEKAARSGGDVPFACLNRLEHYFCSFFAGVNLSLLTEEMLKACQFFKEHRHMTCLITMMINQQTVLELQGAINEEASEAMDFFQQTSISGMIKVRLFNDLYSSYLFNRDDLSVHCDKFFAFEMKSSVLSLRDMFHTLFPGLASYRLYRRTMNSIWLERGRKCKEDMKLWTTQGSVWNFEGKWLLLEAEEHFAVGNIDLSREFYSKSVASCRTHKFLNDEALACELAAKFYSHINEYSTSMEYFRLAREKYLAWGAVKKADEMTMSMRD